MKIGHVIQMIVIAVLITALVVGNNILLEPQMAQNITGIQSEIEGIINFHPFPQDTDTLNAARAGGQELSKQIIQEGSVLVKNNNNTLPLDSEVHTKVNVFGHAAIDWVYGGSGSGQVLPENGKSSENVDFLKALEMYQIEYNESLISMYHNYAAPAGDIGSIGTWYNQFYKLYEPSLSDRSYYSESLLAEAEAYSETAFVVIGRHAGETEDPTRVQYKHGAKTDESRHYLEISIEEEQLLTYVGANYDTVIVIINSTNAMELDFLDTIPGLDACLVVGATGTRAAEAIPYVLYDNGDVSPSGRFTDTYAYDMASNVNYKRTSSAGIGHYTGTDGLYPNSSYPAANAGVGVRTAPAFIDYIEGVYLGYKWYETADVEGVWADNTRYTREILDENDQKKPVSGYDAVVQYPFGYGLSYTTFEWTVDSVSLADGSELNRESEIVLTISVQNTGKVAGKDVVEIYLTPEYKAGGIEKAHVNLVGFAKTAAINPGEKQVLTITLNVDDFAAYDAYDLNKNGNKGYELDAGKYEIKLMTDSHNVKNVTFATGGSNVPGIITYNVSETINLKTDKYTGAEVKNLFTGEDAVDGVSLDGSDSNQNIGFISRANFPDPYEIADVVDRAFSENMKPNNTYDKATASEWDNATTDIFGNPVNTGSVTWGVKAGALEYDGVSYANSVSDGYAKIYMNNKVTSLGLVLGSDYNHPLWDDVLNQLTLAEAVDAVYKGSFGTAAIGSVGKPALNDKDGPSQVWSFSNNSGSAGTGFPCVTVLGQTWSKSLAYSFGINYGKEMSAMGISGCYGFGANLHRSAWGGRNYEYFSEDGFLAGTMLAQQVRGLKNTGKYCYLKHLVLYETEHERDSMYTWCNEQALREIYLVPFEKAIQDGGCVGIMSSYNRIGDCWTGGSEALIQGIIRNEMGFNGAVITDYVDGWSRTFMAIEDAVRAGGDINLGNSEGALKTGFKDGNRIQAQAKEAVHHILYMFLSPLATNAEYNESDDVEQIVVGAVVEPWEWWKLALTDLNIIVGVGCGYWTYFILRDIKRRM